MIRDFAVGNKEDSFMFQTTMPSFERSADSDLLTMGAAGQVFRPIQYLGSKLRTLEPLLKHTRHLYAHNDRVVDCFSGSSVVSQAYANAGAQVTSVDAQLFCKQIASAMLGVDRKVSEECAAVAATIVDRFEQCKPPKNVAVLLDSEATLLEIGATNELVEFYNKLPQVWRRSEGHDWWAASQFLKDSFDFGTAPIIASHYAGTYFGIRQSIFFDFVRNQVRILRQQNAIDEWTASALLTALYSTMSNTVCSAGKHFAQPLAAKATGNKEFRISRLYTDRKIDPADAFLLAARAVDGAAQRTKNKHCSLAEPIDSAFNTILKSKPQLIYADPPYTAQQYSRFYHVLEVAANYQRPELQMIRGKVTAGIYSTNRYKSPYSSRTGAKPAFEDLVSKSRESGASLAISYSSSSESSTGNARMISLKNLANICERHYGKRVDVVELDHAYKPLNSEMKNNVHRSDPEVLIVCEA